MKVLMINTIYPNGSTGKIVRGIEEACKENNIDVRVAYRYKEKGKCFKNSMYISTWLDCHIHNRLSSILGLQGCFSWVRTFKFICKINSYSPDLIHIHNIHGSYINHYLLFRFIKKKKIKTIWTLHDCWAFTGYCPHFTYEKCQKWTMGCGKCPLMEKRFIDCSRVMWKLKKRWFTGCENMLLVTPSIWLANLVKDSYLKDYSTQIINNGIDLNSFKPRESKFRIDYCLENKKVVLGVAFCWGEKKGLDVFIYLSKVLPRDYKIVLVGMDESMKQNIPDDIILIPKTQNSVELSKIYTAADVFVNPTREDTYPTVNMESIACGTPVITFDTGGSAEILNDRCGSVVEYDNIVALEKEIVRVCEERTYNRETCLEMAKEFDSDVKFKDYIKLYLEN